MRAYIPTPPAVVDLMVNRLFDGDQPTPDSRLLDPGCGNGEFIDGVIRWCDRHENPYPVITGVELHPDRAQFVQRKYRDHPAVDIVFKDLLRSELEPFDFIVGNPPYVSITSLSESEKQRYRSEFRTASGRFDLYYLFWEYSLRVLRDNGRLVFITPEKYLTVESARPLRQLLSDLSVRSIQFMPEDTFPGHTTYPVITTLDGRRAQSEVIVTLRSGNRRSILLTEAGDSLAEDLYATESLVQSGTNLEDICVRISCGVATGADKQFVKRTSALGDALKEYAYPTISGRQLAQLKNGIKTTDSILVPYYRDGRLIPEDRLDGLEPYLTRRKAALLSRSCVSTKPWYAFHETPPMTALLKPKILCRDLTKKPQFWLERSGNVIPRHSVYYIIPEENIDIHQLLAYLNGPDAGAWLMANCQRAANGFIRLQSRVLKKLPVPTEALSVNEAA